MQYSDAVSRAIRYIEERLTEELPMEEVAAAAGYSAYHFHRLFQYAARCSVADYIRKRRLTHAAYELFHTDRRIVEIAVRYRFESQEAFTRAFRKQFGMPPGRFRKQTDPKDTWFRAMEKKPLDDAGLRHLHAGITAEPRIVAEKERRCLVGMEIRGINSREIEGLWEAFRRRDAEIGDKKAPDSRSAERDGCPKAWCARRWRRPSMPCSPIEERSNGCRRRSNTSTASGCRSRGEAARTSRSSPDMTAGTLAPRMGRRCSKFISLS